MRLSNRDVGVTGVSLWSSKFHEDGGADDGVGLVMVYGFAMLIVTTRSNDTAIVASAEISLDNPREYGCVLNTTKYGIGADREHDAGFGRVS